MASKKPSKTKESLHDLERALKAYTPTEPGGPRSLSVFALSKAFEVALEYGWKHLKSVVEDKGLEALSPKDAVREAARLGMISEPDVWLRSHFINIFLAGAPNKREKRNRGNAEHRVPSD
jgi:hypothetical protein